MSDEQGGYAPILYKFTNQKQAPELEALLAMFYTGAYENRLGIMQAKNITSGQEELVLVGVSLDAEGKTDCYPLARLLKAEEVVDYRSPDGKGGWYDPLNEQEVTAVKADMLPLDESVHSV